MRIIRMIPENVTREFISFINYSPRGTLSSRLRFELARVKNSLMRPPFLPTMVLLSLNLACASDLRIGIVGCDTSHVVAFTELFQNTNAPGYVAGGHVTAAYKGGSQDIPSSASRVEGFSKTLAEKYGVKFYPTVEELVGNVDAVLLESVDGRTHLRQIRPIIQARKPVFVDKPVAGSLREVITIYRLARENNVPIFSSSAYRYYDGLVQLQTATKAGVRAAISYGPSELEPHHPDLFWYGIHATEALFTVLGPGCETVTRASTKETDVVTGTWGEGRTGVLYGLRTGVTPHKVIAFTNEGVKEQSGDGEYAPLVKEIMRFFQTGVGPVPPEVTIEIYGFMEAADESKRRGGKPVRIADVMRKNGQPSARKF